MNQSTSDKKDRNGGGDVTKAEEVEVALPDPIVVDALNSRGKTRFTEE